MSIDASSVRCLLVAAALLPIACRSSGPAGGGTAGAGGVTHQAGTTAAAGMTGGAGGAGSGGVFGSSAASGAGGIAGASGAQVQGGATLSGGAPSHGGLAGGGGGGARSDSGGVAAGGGSTGPGTGSSSGGVVVGGTTGGGGKSGSGGILSAAGSPGSGGVPITGGTSGTGPVEMVDAAHVRLLSGSPFYDRQELHRKGYLASLSTDKLLYPYRSLAKLAQAGGATSGYAGWDTGFIQGHMTGHYLSAASRMAAATGDTTFTTKVEYVVAELAKCQTALNSGGYLAAFSTVAFDVLEGKGGDAGGIVVPYYTFQKIMSGLLDAYHYLGNKQALDVATKMGDWVSARLAALPAA
ncbi:MAG TPA: beta-L-arabinofuranosidase domain-containing protein, partial [Polyangia bacterium]